MYKKKVKINNIDFLNVVTLANKAEKVIYYLIGLNEQNAKTISEIYNILNKGKSSIGRHSILRTINSLIKYEPEKIKCKLIKGKQYYWMTVSEINAENKIISKKGNKLESNIVNKKPDKLLEKDLYPDVQKWLSKYSINGIDFRFMITGGGFIDKSKYSNPDIIGTNTVSYTHLRAHET